MFIIVIHPRLVNSFIPSCKIKKGSLNISKPPKYFVMKPYEQVLQRLEFFFLPLASRAFPIIRQILELCSCWDILFRITLFRIIDVSTWALIPSVSQAHCIFLIILCHFHFLLKLFFFKIIYSSALTPHPFRILSCIPAEGVNNFGPSPARSLLFLSDPSPPASTSHIVFVYFRPA